MIPIIGFMVGVYILFRMLEVWFFSSSRYQSERMHIVICFVALLVMAVTVLCLLALVASSS